MITELKKNQIFIFGSNLAGKHYGGSAKQAVDSFGAIMGQGEGLQGQSYAFPTLDENFNQLTREQLEHYRDNLIDCMDCNKDKEFLLTKVGCGIAGYDEGYMKSLFNFPCENLVKPINWN